MSRYIALLRGINLGKHNRVGMAQLRGWMGELGHTDVRTHLQSGNVVFTCSEPPEEAAHGIEREITRQLGLDIRVLVRRQDELAAIVARDPLGTIATDPAKYLVTFLSRPLDPERLREIDPAVHEPTVFHAAGREVYLWCPNGVGGTKLTNAFWQKRFAVDATARNWKTVTGLLALAES